MSTITDTESSFAPPAPELQSAGTAPGDAPSVKPLRLISLDAFRGLVMLLMVSAGLSIPHVVNAFNHTPELQHLKTPLWDRLAFHTDHTDWIGCSLWDLIQPSFMFMVGVAMVFSLASRRVKGHSFPRMLAHAIARSIILILLAVFLSTDSSNRRTNWIFTNVLAQIGLGYTFLFLIANLKPRWQLTAALSILLIYWAAFSLYPKPPADLNLAAIGLPADWPRLQGFSSHWEKNANIAWRFDHWFLNLFPRQSPWEFSPGGYATLNFIPSLSTMIFGLLTGALLRAPLSNSKKLLTLFASAVAALVLGWSLDRLGICPLIKRIWTPSWTLYSTGCALVALSFFYLIIDIAPLKLWALPLVVVGMNSIAVYCMSQLLKPWFHETLTRHFGPKLLKIFGDPYAPMVQSALFLLFCWIVCAWMYRKKIFLRI